MIRFLLLFAILLCNISFATEFEPKWENIAPEGFANAEYIENKTFANKHPFLNMFTAMSLVGLPVSIVSLNKSSAIDTNNYWAKRKQEYEEQKEFCKAMESKDNKLNCFNALIQAEHNKTLQRQQIIAAQQAAAQANANAVQTRNAINNMNYNLNRPRTTTFTPIGNTYYMNSY